MVGERAMIGKFFIGFGIGVLIFAVPIVFFWIYILAGEWLTKFLWTHTRLFMSDASSVAWTIVFLTAIGIVCGVVSAAIS
jgi:hypothetical protein